MTIEAIALGVLLLGVVMLCAKPLGSYIADVMEGKPILAVRMGSRLERAIYRLAGIDPARETGWKQYAIGVLLFSVVGVLTVYVLQRLQAWLPLNPQQFGNVTPDSAFNTAISFVTNTNWQGYSGESTMSYLTQMLALAVQNFVSAATGIAVAVALIRGFARHSSATIGNFWVDLTRVTLYVLVPIAAVIALTLISQGVIQNFDAYKEVTTLGTTQYSQPEVDASVAGPRCFRQCRAEDGDHQYSDARHGTGRLAGSHQGAGNQRRRLLQCELCASLRESQHADELSRTVRDPADPDRPDVHVRQDGRRPSPGLGRAGGNGGAVRLAMAGSRCTTNRQGNPLIAAQGVDDSRNDLQPGGNMEGKEARYGIAASALFASVTTATSTGAVNSMHDSMTPLGGLVPMFLIQLGEVAFGGVGSGLYGMLIYALLAVFIAGLMIGRTPEYLGKKIEAFDMKMTSIAILATPLVVLLGTAVAVSVASGKVGVANPGAHGFSEILYAFSSAGNNNGSAFAGLSANTPFYNTALGLAMWFGRFWVIVPVLAIAGSLAAKKRAPVTAGTMPTHGPLFVVLLVGSVLLIGALTYVPALALGPIVEHLMLQTGT